MSTDKNEGHKGDGCPPVSKLPWIKENISHLKLEETQFFKEQMAFGSDNGKFNANLYRLMTETFPLYLPKRYHKMDCVALHKNSANGAYWVQATDFLINSQCNSTLLWNMIMRLEDHVSHADELRNLSYMNQKARAQAFEVGVELCKNSAEFMFEPWVLIQLPWNPALLHQWLVAVLAEIYHLNVELVELRHWYIPCPLLKLVNKFLRAVNTLEDSYFKVMTFLHLVTFYTREFKDNEFNMNDHMYFKSLFHTLPKLLSSLEFVLSGKASEIIKALKRLAWPNRMSIRAKYLMKAAEPRVDSNLFHNIYNHEFWKTGSYVNIFAAYYVMGKQPKCKTKCSCHPKSLSLSVEEIEHSKRKYGENISSEAILSLVEGKIFDCIIGGSKDEILKIISKEHDLYFRFYYYQYKNFEQYLTEGLHKNDHGAISSISYLYCKSNMIDIEHSLIHYISTRLKGHRYLRALDCDGPFMYSSDIQRLIESSNLEHQFTLKEVKSKLPAESREKVNKNECCPDYDEGAVQAALKLEMRIKRMVVGMLEDHLSATPKMRIYHTEWQLVQYLLPCFVAMFLDIHQDSGIDIQGKILYLQFVHELIKSFEVNPYLATSLFGTFSGGYSPFYFYAQDKLRTVVFWQVQLAKSGIGKILNASGNCSEKASEFEKQFARCPHLFIFQNPSKNAGKLTEAHTSSVSMPWLLQVHSFMSRIILAMNAVTSNSLFPRYQLIDAMLTVHTIFCALKADVDTKCNANISESSTKCKELPFLELLSEEAMMKLSLEFGIKFLQKAAPVKNNSENDSLPDDLIAKIKEECASLSVEQIFGLMFLCCCSNNAPGGFGAESEWVKNLGKLRMPINNIEAAFFAFANNELVKLKLLFSTMLIDKLGNDQSIVTVEFARKYPNCYEKVLSRIEGKYLQMKEPCELTMLPIKHCRWCGLVEGDLKLCRECIENDDYPDRNWFCSSECEEQALDKAHTEEHATALVISCKIEDPRVGLQNLQLEDKKSPVAQHYNKKLKKRNTRPKKY